MVSLIPRPWPSGIGHAAGDSREELMGKQVWEDGKSEGLTVTVGIGIQNLSCRESGQTSIW